MPCIATYFLYECAIVPGAFLHVSVVESGFVSLIVAFVVVDIPYFNIAVCAAVSVFISVGLSVFFFALPFAAFDLFVSVDATVIAVSVESFWGGHCI